MELGPILTLKSVGMAAILLAGSLFAGACGGSSGSAAGEGRPQLVVTTTILGDVARELVGDEAEVEVLMPPGADPHEFALSAREADDMAQADLVVVNGAGFEQGMADVIGSAEDAGAPMFTAADHVELRPFVEEDADEPDPHIWTDPTNMVAVTEALGDRLASLDGLDAEAVARRADAYAGEIEALDGEIERTLSAVPADDRRLVTNHEVFGYFAERYDFEVIGTVIPSGTTQAEPSSGEVDALAEVIRDAGVPAIFGETTQATTLADALADEVGEVQVVELYTESVGEEGSGADTYLGMMGTDAHLIADALT